MNILKDEVGIAVNDIHNYSDSYYPQNTVHLDWLYESLPTRNTVKRMKNGIACLKDCIADARVVVIDKLHETPMSSFIEGYIGAHLYEKYNINNYPVIQLLGANHLVKQDGVLKRKPNYHIVQKQADGKYKSYGHIKSVNFNVNAMKTFLSNKNNDIIWILQSNSDYYFLGWFYYMYGYANFVVFQRRGTDEHIELICNKVNADQVVLNR